MGWFTKPIASEATVPRLAPGEQRLLQVEKEYRLAEKEYCDASLQVDRFRHEHNKRFILQGKLYEPSFQASLDPRLKLLERGKSEALDRRNRLLAARAELRKELGVQ